VARVSVPDGSRRMVVPAHGVSFPCEELPALVGGEMEVVALAMGEALLGHVL